MHPRNRRHGTSKLDIGRAEVTPWVLAGHDGIATEEDLISFFTKLPNGDRELAVLGGMAHSVVLGYNRDQLWQVTRSFLERPARHDRIKEKL